MYSPATSRFLNALIREWSGWSLSEEAGASLGTDNAMLRLSLPASHAEVRVPILHVSKTGYHSFAFPMQIDRGHGDLRPVTLPGLVTLLLGEKTLADRSSPAARMTFLRRVLDSAEAIAKIAEISRDERPFAAGDPTFIEAEKALRFGHAVHPSPRSRDEFTGEDSRRYGPEYGNGFHLRWWAVEPQLLVGESATAISPTEAVAALTGGDTSLVARAAATGKALLPLHPWQAARLMEDPFFDRLMRESHLVDLGLGGPVWRATSSLRTVYSAQVPWMLKFSLSLRLTNSRRIVEARECSRGLAIHRLLSGPLGKALKARCPDFEVLGEPVWLALRAPGAGIVQETAVVFRENPFEGTDQPPAAVLAALCERHPDERGSHLADLVRRIAKRSGETEQKVAEDWFGRFLKIAVEPFLIAQGSFGLLFGAHQQNLVLGLKDGWPERLYFRDCQGTGYLEEFLPSLRKHLPEVGSATDHVFDREEAARLVGYYLFVNGAFAVVGALGAARLAEEDRLTGLFRAFLERLALRVEDRTCLDYLLSSPTLAAKGNFMLSLGNVNENTEVTDPLAGYVQLPNPLSRKATP
ncbi:IucA/IucC family siderophore biosynthesis protein [Nitratireductor sp. ZSWI3]|uniref:IucA/IucC family protein n=1 Tax=Nitratireductor sp. ZSWI3 TaxID=2966359 RepID=UPI0021504883|nr:IucA/IucC family protein [Nitratireductor sp. ZSWI3]MCR4264866.1 IucA/IucC family protein [Nitratireductor sp. ZSWI3]